MSDEVNRILDEIRVQLFTIKYWQGRSIPKNLVITISPKLAVALHCDYVDRYDEITTLFGEDLMYNTALEMNQFIIGQKFEIQGENNEAENI